MIIYLIIGVVLALAVDITSDVARIKPRLTLLERIVLIVVWPIGLLNLVHGFLKELLKKKDND